MTDPPCTLSAAVLPQHRRARQAQPWLPTSAAPEVTEGDGQRSRPGDAQDEHVGVEKQGVREPPEGVQGQEAEGLFTEIQVRVEVSGGKREARVKFNVSKPQLFP